MSEQNSPVRTSTGRTRANQEAQAPQQPSSVPSVRLSIHTPPIPAQRTSITSATGSFELQSPFTFGSFGPSTLPEGDFRCASDMIRDTIQAAYEAGHCDGSRFGSIGGSRLGSVCDLTYHFTVSSQSRRNQ